MCRYVTLIALLVFFCVVVPMPSSSDTIKLENGQTFEGEITAEEDGRVQMKVAETGVRIWFSRDQIASLDKLTSEKKTESEKETVTSTTVGLDDDVVRARELLEKLRREPKENQKPEKKVRNKQADDNQNAADAAAASQSQIEKLIDQLRNGKKLEQMSACKKLEALRADEAIPHLIHALDNDGIHVREAANKALIAITGEDFGFPPDANRSVRLDFIKKWQDWYKEQQKEKADAELKALW